MSFLWTSSVKWLKEVIELRNEECFHHFFPISEDEILEEKMIIAYFPGISIVIQAVQTHTKSKTFDQLHLG